MIEILNLNEHKKSKYTNATKEIKYLKQSLLEKVATLDQFDTEEKFLIEGILENNLQDYFWEGNLNESISSIINKFKDLGTAAYQKVTSFLSKIGNLVKKLLSKIRAFFVWIYNLVEKAVKSMIKSGRHKIIELIETAIEKISERDTLNKEWTRFKNVLLVLKKKLLSYDNNPDLENKITSEIENKVNPNNAENLEVELQTITEGIYNTFERNVWKSLNEQAEENHIHFYSLVNELDTYVDSIVVPELILENEVEFDSSQMEQVIEDIKAHLKTQKLNDDSKIDMKVVDSFKKQIGLFTHHTLMPDKRDIPKMILKLIRIVNLPFALMSFVYTTLGVSLNRFLTSLEKWMNKLNWLPDIRTYVILGVLVATILELFLKIGLPWIIGMITGTSGLDFSGFSIAKAITIKPILHLIGLNHEMTLAVISIISIMAVILTCEEMFELVITSDEEIHHHALGMDKEVNPYEA